MPQRGVAADSGRHRPACPARGTRPRHLAAAGRRRVEQGVPGAWPSSGAGGGWNSFREAFGGATAPGAVPHQAGLRSTTRRGTAAAAGWSTATTRPPTAIVALGVGGGGAHAAGLAERELAAVAHVTLDDVQLRLLDTSADRGQLNVSRVGQMTARAAPRAHHPARSARARQGWSSSLPGAAECCQCPPRRHLPPPDRPQAS